MFYPEIQSEDIEAEVTLRKLLGIDNPGRQTIVKELKRQALPILEDGDDAIGVRDAFSGATKPSYEQVKKLLDWAFDRGEEAYNLIDWFFDNREMVEEVIEKLKYAGLVDPNYDENSLEDDGPAGGFTALLRRQFQKYKVLSYEDFIKELAFQEILGSDNPLAVAKAALNKLEDRGEIEYIGGDSGDYRWLGR